MELSELIHLCKQLARDPQSEWDGCVKNQCHDLAILGAEDEIIIAPIRYVTHHLQTGQLNRNSVSSGAKYKSVISCLQASGYIQETRKPFDKTMAFRKYKNYYKSLPTNDASKFESRKNKQMTFWVNENPHPIVVPKDLTNNRSTKSHDNSSTLFPDDLPSDKTYPEGAKKQIFVNAYERSEGARKDCIKHFSENGRIKCEACNLDFVERYGEIGNGFIHVHHKISLEQIDGEYQVDPVNDLVPLCPNCHAMIHRLPDDENSVEALRELIDKNRRHR